MSICLVEGCDTIATKRGMCRKHYLRQWRTGSTELVPRISYKGVICSVDNCGDYAHAHGLCMRHYVRLQKYGRLHPVGRNAQELKSLNCVIIDGSHAAITLTRGYEAIIDVCDIESVTKYTWHAVTDNMGRGGTERVRAQGRVDGVDMYLHQFILGYIAGLEIDHADNNPLNCRRDNLSFVTHQENCSYRGLDRE